MTVAWNKCAQCANKVPKRGQCNQCGWIDSLGRLPEPVDFDRARQVNEEAKYKQFESIDMYIDMEMIRLMREGRIKPQEPAQ